ncbi:hypothetical protein JKP88DRAFT_246105 [Tribonema minus]|uniref:Uncharacterized protein n=1 Tax=Tribonema minus TaxID=303371 RepID=A0A835YW18_9STRA|nr:hypothetical protein JKP88DRAFT_246105 [Tribonema minus]
MDPPLKLISLFPASDNNVDEESDKRTRSEDLILLFPDNSADEESDEAEKSNRSGGLTLLFQYSSADEESNSEPELTSRSEAQKSVKMKISGQEELSRTTDAIGTSTAEQHERSNRKRNRDECLNSEPQGASACKRPIRLSHQSINNSNNVHRGSLLCVRPLIYTNYSGKGANTSATTHTWCDRVWTRSTSRKAFRTTTPMARLIYTRTATVKRWCR